MVSAEIDFLESDDHIDNVREWEDDTDCGVAGMGGKSAAKPSKGAHAASMRKCIESCAVLCVARWPHEINSPHMHEHPGPQCAYGYRPNWPSSKQERMGRTPNHNHAT